MQHGTKKKNTINHKSSVLWQHHFGNFFLSFYFCEKTLRASLQRHFFQPAEKKKHFFLYNTTFCSTQQKQRKTEVKINRSGTEAELRSVVFKNVFPWTFCHESQELHMSRGKVVGGAYTRITNKYTLKTPKYTKKLSSYKSGTKSKVCVRFLVLLSSRHRAGVISLLAF